MSVYGLNKWLCHAWTGQLKLDIQCSVGYSERSIHAWHTEFYKNEGECEETMRGIGSQNLQGKKP